MPKEMKVQGTTVLSKRWTTKDQRNNSFAPGSCREGVSFGAERTQLKANN